MTGQGTTPGTPTSETERDSGDSTSTCRLRFSKCTMWRMSAARAFFKGDTIDQLVIFFVRWPLHVCIWHFAQHAVEHGAPCVSLFPQQGLTLVGLLALAFAFGGFFLFLALSFAFLSLLLPLLFILPLPLPLFLDCEPFPFPWPPPGDKPFFSTSQRQWLQRLW